MWRHHSRNQRYFSEVHVSTARNFKFQKTWCNEVRSVCCTGYDFKLCTVTCSMHYILWFWNTVKIMKFERSRHGQSLCLSWMTVEKLMNNFLNLFNASMQRIKPTPSQNSFLNFFSFPPSWLRKSLWTNPDSRTQRLTVLIFLILCVENVRI